MTEVVDHQYTSDLRQLIEQISSMTWQERSLTDKGGDQRHWVEVQQRHRTIDPTMASSRTNRAQSRVCYTEVDSDEAEAAMSEATSLIRTGASRATRRRKTVTYAELDSNSDNEAANRDSRGAHTIERVSDGNDADGSRDINGIDPFALGEFGRSNTTIDSMQQAFSEIAYSPRRRTAARPLSRRDFEDSSRKLKRRRIAQTNTRAQPDVKRLEIQQTGTPMPWQTLPHFIWQIIFSHASESMFDTKNIGTSPMQWLLDTARICSAFTGPALTVLYQSPCLTPMHRLQEFVQQVESGQVPVKHRVKVKCLTIDVGRERIFNRKKDREVAKFMSMIYSLLPNVKSVTITDSLDGLQRRAVNRGVTYPPDVLYVADETEARFQVWSWDGRLQIPAWREGDISAQFLALHISPSFQSIRRLSLIHADRLLHRLSIDAYEFMDNVNCLPHLTDLHIVQCNESFLLALCETMEQNVEVFTVTDTDITAPTLAVFLARRANRLRRLVLDHNASLDLSWLSNLGTFAPRLEHLAMNMQYPSSYGSLCHGEPAYDKLLTEDAFPEWPRGLRHVEFQYMRKWPLEATNMFFQSLVDASTTLPHLRKLIIKASIQVSSWRDRASFRDSWLSKLNNVFLRQAVPPNPAWSSIRSFHEWKKICSDESLQLRPPIDTTQPLSLAGKSKSEPDDSSPVPRRRSQRAHVKPSDSLPLAEASDLAGLDDQARQGRCAVVNVVIDNLRPADEQFVETDFLDEEASGDEDWDGHDDYEGAFAGGLLADD